MIVYCAHPVEKTYPYKFWVNFISFACWFVFSDLPFSQLMLFLVCFLHTFCLSLQYFTKMKDFERFCVDVQSLTNPNLTPPPQTQYLKSCFKIPASQIIYYYYLHKLFLFHDQTDSDSDRYDANLASIKTLNITMYLKISRRWRYKHIPSFTLININYCSRQLNSITKASYLKISYHTSTVFINIMTGYHKYHIIPCKHWQHFPQ